MFLFKLLNKEQLTVGVVVNGDPNCGDRVVQDLRKVNKENSRINTLDFDRVDFTLFRKCVCGTLENALKTKEARREIISQVIFKHCDNVPWCAGKYSFCIGRLLNFPVTIIIWF